MSNRSSEEAKLSNRLTVQKKRIAGYDKIEEIFILLEKHIKTIILIVTRHLMKKTHVEKMMTMHNIKLMYNCKNI